MLTLKTNSIVMTVLMMLSVIAYSDYFSPQSCLDNLPSYLVSSSECYSSNSIVLDEFQPSFPH